jgi:superfamily II DNA or RNA helicase
MVVKHKTLTRQGYFLDKKKLTIDQLKKIKKELNVKPKTSPSFPSEDNSFDVYSETKKFICVPRYYGTKNFGNAKVIDNMKGHKSKMTFNGSLRDSQTPIVKKCLDRIKSNGGGILSLPCGSGKCLSRGTLIIMYNGEMKKVEEIIVGDKIMGDDSKPRTILSLAQGQEEMFDIIPTKGPKYTVNKSHILSLKYNTIKPSCIQGSGYTKQFKKGDIVDIKLTDYLGLSKYYHGKESPLRGYRESINFKSTKIDLDPYMLGYWLGDGSATQGHVSTEDCEIVNYFKKTCAEHNLNLKQCVTTEKFMGELRYQITTGSYDEKTKSWTDNCNQDNYFYQQLQKLNVLNNKHFPLLYKCNSRKVRLEVLAGMLDANGHNTHNCFDIIQIKEELIDDIIYIARSLGLSAYKTECIKTCTIVPGGLKKVKCFRTCISGDTHLIPTKIKRKQCTKRNQIKDVTIYGISVKSVGIGDYYGFTINGNRRFLLGDFTVTHNTVIAINMACELGLKTLVVVHKTFLQNQWYERIKQFTDAKIGMIRQNKIDTEDKDIVVGMLQSIALKDYDQKIFDEYGLVIFDECFVRKEKVITNNGSIRIGQLYDMWKANEELPLIKSFNETTKQFEFKKLTYAWEKEATKLLRVKFGKRSIICTPKHKFLTLNGYIQAKHLKPQDVLVSIKNNGLDLDNCKIISIENQPIKNRYKNVYDIEVEDNHNFIIGGQTDNRDGPIVHNCHHLGARGFSKAMTKTGGHYTLGLSATPHRNDGLTKLIEWNLGKIMYRMIRKGDKNVAIKIFNYESNDPLFKEKKQWMKGRIGLGIPKMITNIGQIKGRNKFCIKIINCLRNQQGRKILVLSNRIAHLKYLKEEIDKQIELDIKNNELEEEEIVTGFYIGKMKESQLADSEKADIIFGSYAMAEEGLDIPSLNTLVLLTPIKNITQTVGRILRKPIKEGDINPLVIDIVDEFSIFSSWGRKRKAYYQKNEYTVDSYQAWDSKCVTIKSYLTRKKIIKKGQKKVNIRKEYICHKYGHFEWELEEDLNDEEDIVRKKVDEKKLKYKSNLSNLLKVDIEFKECETGLIEEKIDL